MKKLRSVLLVIVMIIVITVPNVVIAAESTTKSLGTGFTHILFENGYTGYCLDYDKNGAATGMEFVIADTSKASHNKTDEDISQGLKVMFTQCFDVIFESDGNGGYEISADTSDKVLQAAIYYLTGDYSYVYGNQKVLTDAAEGYSGPAIPDHGYVVTLENGDTITYDFMVLQPKDSNADIQDFFAYHIKVENGKDHEHVFGETWCYDETNHWKECECKVRKEEGEHSGKEATCIESAFCTICKEYYGELDETNHTGETELKDQKDATEEEEGYTGDTYCKACNSLIEKGNAIPKLPNTQDEEVKVPETPENPETPGEPGIAEPPETEVPAEPEPPETEAPGEPGIAEPEPSETEIPETSETPKAPDTGDVAPISMWICLFAISMLGCVVILKRTIF